MVIIWIMLSFYLGPKVITLNSFQSITILGCVYSSGGSTIVLRYNRKMFYNINNTCNAAINSAP
jgi:hypothetical protein